MDEIKTDTAPSSSAPFTRSATEPLRKYYCFFCQKDDGQDLFTVRTENAGKELQQAVKISQNPVLMTRLIMQYHLVMLMQLMFDTTRYAGYDMYSMY